MMGHTDKEHYGAGLPYDGTTAERKAGGVRRAAVPVILAGALGIVLLLFGNSLFPACGGRTGGTASAPEASGLTSEERVNAYRAELEARIEALCAQVGGAGEVTAAVSLDGGFRTVYAEEEKSGAGGTYRVYVTVGSGASQSAVLIGEEAPPITGIGIVCTGGNDVTVRREITALLSAAFSVGSNKIYVTGR